MNIWKQLGRSLEDLDKGGPGSGFHGHSGRPGMVGGSDDGGGDSRIFTIPDGSGEFGRNKEVKIAVGDTITASVGSETVTGRVTGFGDRGEKGKTISITDKNGDSRFIYPDQYDRHVSSVPKTGDGKSWSNPKERLGSIALGDKIKLPPLKTSQGERKGLSVGLDRTSPKGTRTYVLYGEDGGVMQRISEKDLLRHLKS